MFGCKNGTNQSDLLQIENTNPIDPSYRDGALINWLQDLQIDEVSIDRVNIVYILHIKKLIDYNLIVIITVYIL